MEWIKYLKKSSYKDTKTFNKWINDEIDLEQCIDEFRKNNRIPNHVHINTLEFAIWLNGLGWVKYEID